jgi:uncharacterized protein
MQLERIRRDSMKISNQKQLPCGPAEAWSELNTVEVLQKCIPGCESITRTEEDGYEAVVLTKIGPVKARFKGSVTIEELEPLARYRMSGAGNGGLAGYAKGEAEVTLEEVQPDQTLMNYDVNARIGGKIAQVGSRLVQGVVERLADEFFQRFTDHLQEREDVRAAGSTASPEA